MFSPLPDRPLLPPPSLTPAAAPQSQNRAVRNRARSSRHPGVVAAEQPDWNGYTCEFLITRILRLQHSELRSELHQLEDIAAAAEASTRPEAGEPSPIGRVQSALATLAGELDIDFAEEERLYPRLLDVERAYVGMDCASAPPQPVHSSLHSTVHRHGIEKRRLDRIEAAIHSFNPAAGTVDHVLWNRLLRFHRNLLTHFHVEDYVLLPRVTRMEAELFG